MYMTKNTSSSSKLTRDVIAQHFHLPFHQAVVSLKVSEDELRTACRRLNILRWPYRKRKNEHTFQLLCSGGSINGNKSKNQTGKACSFNNDMFQTFEIEKMTSAPNSCSREQVQFCENEEKKQHKRTTRQQEKQHEIQFHNHQQKQQQQQQHLYNTNEPRHHEDEEENDAMQIDCNDSFQGYAQEKQQYQIPSSNLVVQHCAPFFIAQHQHLNQQMHQNQSFQPITYSNSPQVTTPSNSFCKQHSLSISIPPSPCLVTPLKQALLPANSSPIRSPHTPSYSRVNGSSSPQSGSTNMGLLQAVIDYERVKIKNLVNEESLTPVFNSEIANEIFFNNSTVQ